MEIAIDLNDKLYKRKIERNLGRKAWRQPYRGIFYYNNQKRQLVPAYNLMELDATKEQPYKKF